MHFDPAGKKRIYLGELERPGGAKRPMQSGPVEASNTLLHVIWMRAALPAEESRVSPPVCDRLGPAGCSSPGGLFLFLFPSTPSSSCFPAPSLPVPFPHPPAFPSFSFFLPLSFSPSRFPFLYHLSFSSLLLSRFFILTPLYQPAAPFFLLHYSLFTLSMLPSLSTLPFSLPFPPPLPSILAPLPSFGLRQRLQAKR